MVDPWFAIAIGASAIVAGILAFRHLRPGHGEAAWVARVSADLMDLHLNVRKLPEAAHSKFFSEASAVYQATDGAFHRKHFAMRFFSWYATEYPIPDIRSFTIEGAISGAIPVIRDWARDEPCLADAAQIEIQKIGMFLYRGIERAPISEEEKIEAQLNLLQMMGARGTIIGREEL